MIIKVSENNIKKIVKYLKEGKALIIKTDTVWGLISCNAQLLYDMKKRPLNKPLVRLVSSSIRMHNMTRLHSDFLKTFWPGPVTVIKSGIAYRFPKDKQLEKIIKHLSTWNPLFCTSANISGGDPIDNYDDACSIFNEWGENCVYVVPRNDECHGSSSTIVDIDEWRVLRDGPNVRNVNLWIYKNVVIPFNESLQKKEEAPKENKNFNWNCCNTRWLTLTEDVDTGEISIRKGKKERNMPFFSKEIYDKKVSLEDNKNNRYARKKHFKW